MASMSTLEARIVALEARLADVEGGYGQTLYRLHRRQVRTDINIRTILTHLQLPEATEEEVDAELDQE